MTTLLAIAVVFALLWALAIGAWLLTVLVLEPLGIVSDPGCDCRACRGMRPE